MLRDTRVRFVGQFAVEEPSAAPRARQQNRQSREAELTGKSVRHASRFRADLARAQASRVYLHKEEGRSETDSDTLFRVIERREGKLAEGRIWKEREARRTRGRSRHEQATSARFHSLRRASKQLFPTRQPAERAVQASARQQPTLERSWRRAHPTCLAPRQRAPGRLARPASVREGGPVERTRCVQALRAPFTPAFALGAPADARPHARLPRMLLQLRAAMRAAPPGQSAAAGVARPPATLDDTPSKPPDSHNELEAGPSSSPRSRSPDLASAGRGCPEREMGQIAASRDDLDAIQHGRAAHAEPTASDPLAVRTPEVDEDDEALFFDARRRARTPSPEHEGAWDKVKRKAKQRPATSNTPASTWAGQLSHLTFPSPGRKSTSLAGSLSSTSTVTRPASYAGRSDATSTVVAATTPTRSRSSSVDGYSSSAKGTARRSRASPSPSFRNSLRLPFLPSIPASPLPPILSPGLTRSASSPPILPNIATGGPLSPTFALIPPTAALSPASHEQWPAHGRASSSPPLTHLHRASTSSSAPNLPLVANAPISEPSSYFTSPATTAASSPGAEAPCPLPLSSALGLRSGSQDSDPLTYDSDLLVADADTALVEAKEQADRVQLNEKRYHALVELVETERGYLEHLRVLVKVRALCFVRLADRHSTRQFARIDPFVPTLAVLALPAD